MPRGVYIRTKEYREKISKANKGRFVSPETRLKISLANKGTKPAPQTIRASVKARIGKPLSNEHRIKIGRSGSSNAAWKGNDASYWAKHMWVNSHLRDPMECKHCGTTANLQWANIDHKYSRNIEDWLRLCAKCHRRHDEEKGIRKHNYANQYTPKMVG